MHLEDQDKTTFVTELGIFVAVVMMFGLKTAPVTFQWIISEVFGEYIPAFMQVFLDDFTVYGKRQDHLHHLQLCLERCHAARFSLNLAKCAFGVTSGTLLGHIVSAEGITVNRGKIETIIKSPTPKNAKALGQFVGQLRWHSCMLRHLADFATPLHATVHCTPFRWTETEDMAYEALKVILTQASAVQPPDWTRPFHVFVDASDIAIGSTLIQHTVPNWY